MKKLRFLCAASLAAMLFSACSDDKIVNEPNVPVNPFEQEEGVYFSLNISLPNAVSGRSVTENPEDGLSASDAGTEIGQDYENVVNEAIIVLAEADNNNFIAAATITSTDLTAQIANKSVYRAQSKFSKTVLSAFYAGFESVPAELSANVFLFCNPTSGIREAIFGKVGADGVSIGGAEQGKNTWVNKVGNVDENSPIWTKNNFLMSNAKIAKRQIPVKIEDWNYYTTEDTPFNLSGANDDLNINNEGAIMVERSSARFDFRDASQEVKNPTGKPFAYHVVYVGANDNTVEEIPIIDIELKKMSLVNVGKSFYFLPHVVEPAAGSNGEYAVSVDGTIDESALINGVCQPEKAWGINALGGIQSEGNYVIDPDYQWKNKIFNLTTTEGASVPFAEYSQNLLYPFFDKNGNIDNADYANDRWATYKCENVVAGDPDSWTDKPDKYKNVGQYRIWRYATENTIPSIDGQIEDYSTGVVFKGKMLATDKGLGVGLTETQKDLIDADVVSMCETINNTGNKLNGTDADPILYLYSGSLYMSWPSVREAAIRMADPRFKWIKEPTAEDPDGGHWELVTINRTNSLFQLVFGKDGHCGKFTFKYNDEGSGEKVEVTYEDGSVQAGCADDLWTKWQNKMAESKDSSGNPNPADYQAEMAAFKESVTTSKMTIYQSSYDPDYGYGYYCYYYYWNRHNNNGINGVMGPMEFAVVRNNVYKLAVTKISRLGHPRIAENDPDKPKPGTPDEKENVYMTVEAKVIPWVVRVNDIEF